MQRQHRQDFARKLRATQTSAEVLLWRYLRKRTCGGYRFNRQASIGPFTVDFLCREKMFIIEVDGATHGDAADVAYDTRRSGFLKTKGYSVYRVNNSDIYENIAGVLDGLLMALKDRESKFRPRAPSALRAPPPAS